MGKTERGNFFGSYVHDPVIKEDVDKNFHTKYCGDIENVFCDEDYERLKRYCNYKWREKGENILHRAYLRAFESIIKGNYAHRSSSCKEKERSALYYYVMGILQSACEDELLALGWRKKARKVAPASTDTPNDSETKPRTPDAKEKVWYETETPASVLNVDDNGKEHGLDEFADPKTIDIESQLFPGNEHSCAGNLHAEDVSQWFIAEIKDYVLHLRNICDFDKLFVLRAMCTKGVSLKDVAEEKGLSHQNMTPIAMAVCDELAKRVGIPRDRVRQALNTIKKETALNSQLSI